MGVAMIRTRLAKALSKISSAFAMSKEMAQVQSGQTENISKAAAGAILTDRTSELIAASGQGTVAIAPDSVRTELGIEVRARLLTQAKDELALKIAELSQAISSLGKANLSVQTSDLRIVPLYDEPAEGQPAKIVGYRARNTLLITLRHADAAFLGEEAAAIIDAGVTAGANIVEGVSFFLSNPEAAQSEALKIAVANAERNARVMANSAGVRITMLHDINGVSERPMPILFREDVTLRSLGKIEPGEVSMTATVAVRYHFARL